MSNDEHVASRRSSKPLMEKRRRARINDSLLQLKNLVLDALNKNNPRHSKLEKADILEMTVRYLRSINRQNPHEDIGLHNEEANVAQYQTGYTECLHEVSRYLDATGHPNNASNQTVVLRNLMNREASERHLQTSLLNHLVTQCTDYDRSEERMIVQGQKKVAVPPNVDRHATNNVGHCDIPTLHFCMAGDLPSMTSHEVPGAYAPNKNGNSARSEVQAGASPSSVFCERGVLAPVDPTACPSVNPTGPIVGDGIRLVLPRNLVYSGQIPTHVIPVYAPTISTAQMQPSTVFSNVQTPSTSSTTRILAPVAPSDGHISKLSGSDVTAANSGFSFITTPPPSTHPAQSSALNWMKGQSQSSNQSSASTVTNNCYLNDLKSHEQNSCVTLSSFTSSSPISSSSSSSISSPSSSLIPSVSPAHDLTQHNSAINTLIIQSSQPQSHSHQANVKSKTENKTSATPPYSDKTIRWTMTPTQTTISPTTTTTGLMSAHGRDGTQSVSKRKITTSKTFRPPSTNSVARKRQRTKTSQDTHPSGVRNATPPPHLPNTDKGTKKIGTSRSDMPPIRCRSPLRFISDQPFGLPPGSRSSDGCPDRNENAPQVGRDVNASGFSRKVAWRPW
ncbi:protein deadpan-like [Lytechinus pictus]|uniref:protein deadpan-like n=1 Tax=Lytechinus pictus TaxID=7653 RepID=UPI0030B9F357